MIGIIGGPQVLPLISTSEVSIFRERPFRLGFDVGGHLKKSLGHSHEQHPSCIASKAAVYLLEMLR